jgi:hypothetical protein
MPRAAGHYDALVGTELLAVVKHDCPVCIQLLPALDAAAAAGAPLRILSQSTREETEELATRLALHRTPVLDEDLRTSDALDLDAVPALVLMQEGRAGERVEGLDRARMSLLAERAGVRLDLGGLPEHRPGCASLTRDPLVAPLLAARRARSEGHIRARELTIGALEDPFEALFERGVTDGLPVVPPTPARVVTMLAGTARDSQEVVGVVPPYNGQATVEKVAVNAVMAGCTPEHLPVVLAAVEAACDPAFALHGLLATTYPAGPAVVVSGPLAARIRMNAAGNCLGQGNRANLCIGRALQLVVRNVGGGRPGEEDRAAHGQMGKLASCFAERIEDSPWEPLSVDRGFGRTETTVTLYAAEAPRVIVDQLAREPEGLCRSLALGLEAVSHPKSRYVFDALLVIGPEHARVFAEHRWGRARVRETLNEYTARPAGELMRGAAGSPEGLDPALFGALAPGTPVTKFLTPERIGLVHAGGDAGLFSMIFGMWASGDIGSTPVTRSVEPWR